MEAARRLRKSYLGTMSNGEIGLDLGINQDLLQKKLKNKYKNLEQATIGKRTEKKKWKIKLDFKTKVMIKLFLCCFILFAVVFSKYILPQEIKQNTVYLAITQNYKKDYTKLGMLENVEEISKKSDSFIGEFIPKKIKTYVVNGYVNYVKPYISNFSVVTSFKQWIGKDSSLSPVVIYQNDVDVYKETDIYEKEQTEELTGKGGAEPLEKKEEAVSAISNVDEKVAAIQALNISFIKPVNGTVTSKYGAREQIFDNVNPYHTGIDVANKLNTPVKSSIDGTVISTVSGNKYYGNYVEVENKGVITKYAHLNSISVKKGSIIKQGDTVGLMGSTGMSTGSHVHFEIKYQDTIINPEEVVVF